MSLSNTLNQAMAIALSGRMGPTGQIVADAAFPRTVKLPAPIAVPAAKIGMTATYRSALPQCGAAVATAMAGVAVASAGRIAESAKALVPVDSGDLKDAIHLESGDNGGVLVVAGDHNAFYGHMIEFGTTKTPPRPFLLPAAEAEVSVAEREAAAALRVVLP